MAKEFKTLVDDMPSGTARRTPERQALAEAIAKRDAARERVARLEGAIAAAYEQRVKSWEPRRVAEAELAEAKKNLPKNSFERIQPGADGALAAAEDARRRLEATEGECEKQKIIHTDLENELAEARQSVSFADNVDRAVERVIETSPEAEELLAEFSAVARSYAPLRATVVWLYGHGLASRLVSAARDLIEQAEVKSAWSAGNARAPEWSAALTALSASPDAPLPSRGRYPRGAELRVGPAGGSPGALGDRLSA
jgi:hypothetical protein